VRSLRDDNAFDPVRRNDVEPDGEHVTRRIDHLDLLAGARPQRAGKVAGISTGDGDAPARSLSEK
jgi:hypothetical protein